MKFSFEEAYKYGMKNGKSERDLGFLKYAMLYGEGDFRNTHCVDDVEIIAGPIGCTRRSLVKVQLPFEYETESGKWVDKAVFYRSTGENSLKPGTWFPIDAIVHRPSMVGEANWKAVWSHWFDKGRFSELGTSLERFGNRCYKKISQLLTQKEENDLCF